MFRHIPRKIVLATMLGMLLVSLVILPQSPVGKAGEGKVKFIAVPYRNVIRFKALNDSQTMPQGANSVGEISAIQVQIFNLAGQKIFDSGVRPGQILDWERITDSGDRPAYGVYLYVIKAWDGQGNMSSSQVSKMLLLPNEAKFSPAPTLEQPDSSGEDSEAGTEEGSSGANQVAPMLQEINDDLAVYGNLRLKKAGPVFNIRTTDTTWPQVFFKDDTNTLRGTFTYKVSEDMFTLRKMAGAGVENERTKLELYDSKIALMGGNVGIGTDSPSSLLDIAGQANAQELCIGGDCRTSWPSGGSSYWAANGDHIYNTNSGKVGIGTDSPSGTLTIKSSSADNLIELYNTGTGGSATNPVFRVERYDSDTGTSGNVYADGAYYCGLSTQDACFNAGVGADVAERINTSEWVEKGNVVEIDPKHPGFFRKTHFAYSTKVAGVISTSPGVTLGNSFSGQNGKWEDNRPLLALAGRVPVKATTENGPIKVGDLLVSSSNPGYAMKCSNRTKCIGATIGKALESLEEGTGIVMAQVMLR